MAPGSTMSSSSVQVPLCEGKNDQGERRGGGSKGGRKEDRKVRRGTHGGERRRRETRQNLEIFEVKWKGQERKLDAVNTEAPGSFCMVISKRKSFQRKSAQCVSASRKLMLYD